MSANEATTVLRILDANANRAGEGLRVVEEYLRLALDDAHLAGLCKTLRHDLAEALTEIPCEQRQAARETSKDVGTHISTAGELRRADLSAVVAANLQRAEQSLRSLEEYAKIISPAVAPRFESLRYRLYTLEKAIGATREALQRLASARLYVLIDGGESLEQFVTLATGLVAAGVHLLQLRDKRLDDRRLIERARKLRELTSGTNTLFIMNDRPDLAVLARADGVHVGQEELSVKDARSIVGPKLLIGVSTHSLEQARQAVLDGASYLGVGPTFPSATKSFAAHTGLDLLRAVAAEIRLPAFAIGGIDRANLPDVLATGFRRVAVANAVAGAANSREAAQELLARLSENRVAGG